jgi:hypothetical protein
VQVLALGLSVLSSAAILLILVTTIILTYQGKLFGNDLAIAITTTKAGAPAKPQRPSIKRPLQKRQATIDAEKDA